MIYNVIQLAQESFPDGGTILEFGIGPGGSYIQLASKILEGWSCKLIGFDSFQGLPKEVENVWIRPEWKEGAYSHPQSFTENALEYMGITLPDERFKFVGGWFKDTLTKELQQSIKNVILINVDVDLYVSTVLVLNFIRPLLQKGTIVYFDDWVQPQENCGERLAFEQWIMENPEIGYELSPIGLGQQLMRVRNI